MKKDEEKLKSELHYNVKSAEVALDRVVSEFQEGLAKSLFGLDGLEFMTAIKMIDLAIAKGFLMSFQTPEEFKTRFIVFISDRVEKIVPAYFRRGSDSGFYVVETVSRPGLIVSSVLLTE